MATSADIPPSAATTDPLRSMREEFRQHLELFYGRLKLAPPYHSVEKAVQHLTTAINALEPAERARLSADASLRWAQFRRAFEASGLHKKHRGIIAGLARDRSALDLPAECEAWLDLFRS